MSGKQALHVVLEFTDVVDSVWTCRDSAEVRKEQLDKSNGGEFARVKSYFANTPDGWAGELGKPEAPHA